MKKYLTALLIVFSILFLFSCQEGQGEEETPTHEHVWPEYYALEEEPTVDFEGIRVYTCSLCGATKEVAVPVLNEDNYFLIRTPATCEEEGSDLYISEEWGEYEIVTAPIGHEYGSTPTESTTTCTENGEDIYVCARCGQEKRIAKGAYGHDTEFVAVHEGNCVEKKDGCTEYRCKRCGEVFYANYQPYTHAYVAGEHVAGSCTQKGYTPYVCADCGEIYNQEDDYAHAYNKETGKCTLCGAACRHDFDDYVCTACGFSIREELTLRSGVYRDGKDVYLGVYPQSRETSQTALAALDEMYRQDQSEYVYMGLTYTAVDVSDLADRGRLFFSDDTSVSPVTSGRSVYFFRHDPIVWHEAQGGVLVAEKILDFSVFQPETELTQDGTVFYYDRENQIYANDWSVSVARSFLSGGFYNRAFGQKAKELLTQTENSNENVYYPEDEGKPWLSKAATTDVVFLPSFSDLYENKDAVTDEENAELSKELTDYALCLGGRIDDKTGRKTKWFLRSSGLYSAQVMSISSGGSLYTATQVYERYGVVPAIKVVLPA